MSPAIEPRQGPAKAWPSSIGSDEGVRDRRMSSLRINRRQFLGSACWAGSMIASRAFAGPTGSVRRINVVATQGVTGLTLQEMARAQGFFDEFNIDQNMLLVSDSAKCVAALLSGSAKLCAWSGFNQLIPAIERGAKLKILAGSLSLPSLALYSSRKEI